MRIYNNLNEMVQTAKEHGIPMSVMYAEAMNQILGRLSLLEEDHQAIIEENKKLKKKLKMDKKNK